MGPASILPTALTILAGILDNLTGDKRREAEQAMELLKMAQRQADGQMEINKEEARSASLFVAGWRPAVGWVCVLGLGYEFLLRPIGIWALAVWNPGGPIPPSLGDVLVELVCAMLGVGALRSFDKSRGGR